MNKRNVNERNEEINECNKENKTKKKRQEGIQKTTKIQERCNQMLHLMNNGPKKRTLLHSKMIVSEAKAQKMSAKLSQL